MANTKVTINVGKWKLHVELDDRPVDFDIEFPSGKRVSFKRTKGPIGTDEQVDPSGGAIEGPALVLPPTPTTPPGKTRKQRFFKDPVTGDEISYISDPGM